MRCGFAGLRLVATIRQTLSELVLDAGGQTFVFRLDSTENVYIDRSLGDLPNFVRKIRTKAHWERERLLTERTSFAEQADPSGKVTTPAGAITIVDALTISPDRRTLTVEHSGFRAAPPDLLHGEPYNPADDPAVRRYTGFFSSVK